MHFAAAEGRLDLMRQLLGRSCAVDELNQEGLTPLQVASLRGDLALVKLLLAHGARPNVAAAKGKTSDMAVSAASSGALMGPSFWLVRGVAVWGRAGSAACSSVTLVRNHCSRVCADWTRWSLFINPSDVCVLQTQVSS